ncbi:hypothetical protein HYC85_004397 [Camellia sinensis]|uniref:CobW C-terminal domain-containing protein n=1 Tax=Camellia sinensis TaxID=4442 RepID=A0A7J7HWF3_CAMSI|nr:hypothetical protein HYC85_004397 [Camellia sinensis]
MASMSMDIATTFIGLAKLQTTPRSRVRASVFPLLWRSKFRNSQSLRTISIQPRIVSIDLSKSNPFSRRFTAAAATATPQTDGSDVSTKIPPDDRVPATIITGFLGSGKTTLLNHILTADHGKRIAVIENEYGEVDIDGSLVAAKAAGAEDIVMLNNGCLCCTVRGLANPAPIIQTFYAEDQIFNEVKLDGVVTLVDAKHADFHLDDVKAKGVVNEAVEQIAYADQSKVLSTLKVQRKIMVATITITNTNTNMIMNTTISMTTNMANMWLGTLLLERSDDIYRMKGLLSVEGMNERFVFQGVHDIFQGSPDRLWGPDEPRTNKIVFIGKNLNAQELEKGKLTNARCKVNSFCDSHGCLEILTTLCDSECIGDGDFGERMT